MKYLIVIEKTGTGFSAYAPDVNGCVATGYTKREVEANMKEALEFHVEGLRLGRRKIPRARASSHYLDIAVAVS